MRYTWRAALVAAALVLALAVGRGLYDGIYESGRRDCANQHTQLADGAARRACAAAEAQATRNIAAAKAQTAACLARMTHIDIAP